MGGILACLGETWGAPWGRDAMRRRCGAVLGHLESLGLRTTVPPKLIANLLALVGILGHLEAVLGQLGATLGLVGAVAILEPSWGHLGAILGYLGLMLGHL